MRAQCGAHTRTDDTWTLAARTESTPMFLPARCVCLELLARDLNEILGAVDGCERVQQPLLTVFRQVRRSPVLFYSHQS